MGSSYATYSCRMLKLLFSAVIALAILSAVTSNPVLDDKEEISATLDNHSKQSSELSVEDYDDSSDDITEADLIEILLEAIEAAEDIEDGYNDEDDDEGHHRSKRGLH